MQFFRHLLFFAFFISFCFLLRPTHAEVSEDIMDRVQTDEFINEQIAKAQIYATQYTDPDFLDSIINADQISEQKQRNFNNTLFYDASLEIGSLFIPMGIYNADIQNIAHLGATWGMEWWLHHVFTNLFAETYLQNLINGEQSLPWNKKIIPLLFAYALANVASQRTTKHFLLHQAPIGASNPPSISSLLPSTAKITLSTNLSPHAWTTMINNFFKKIGWLPPWTEHFAWEITKEFLTLLMWVRWHEHSVLRPALQQRISDNQEAVDAALVTLKQLNKKEIFSQEEKNAATEVCKTLHFFIFDSIHMPFIRWITYKTTQLSFWHTIANLVVATPAWYRTGKWAYQMYNNVTKAIVDEELS